MAALAMACRVGLSLLVASSRGVLAQWSVVSPSTSALSDAAPPSSFGRRDNILFPVAVSSALSGTPALLHTNKFYSHFVFDAPYRSAWTLPYIVTVNDEIPFGLYVSHPKYFEGGRDDTGDRIKWYATTATKDIILSAQELETSQEATLTGFDDAGLSATVQFTSSDTADGSMTTFLVRGMAYVTVMYDNFTPMVSTIHALLQVNGNSASSSMHTSDDGRFVLEFNDGNTWILYSSDTSVEFVYEAATTDEPSWLKAQSPMTGTLRAALVPYGEDDALFADSVGILDEYSGSYPTEGSLQVLSHDTNSNRGRYIIDWTTSGSGSGLLHYSLPHQQALLADSSRSGLYLSSPTKGDMELTTGTTWTFTERDLPDFDWLPSMDAITSDTEMAWVDYYLESEINVPLDNVAGSSIYFGAKHLMAYAQLCLIADEMGRDGLLETCMNEVEAGFDYYLEHTNGNPLVYDETWGGVIGSLGLEEDGGGADFYASYYNDHHFHYGYLINAAAVLAHLRPAWATTANKEWVNTLIRDVNCPNQDDEYFPQYRAFDWFSGHSWARGLLYAGDGKDQESTSEDVNFYYAMTMWAIATGNSELEGLGRLQTGMVTRSIQEYFLLKDTNTNHPADFVKNKVTGIFFESKVDYTTWFGDNVEYIHGIQNIPATAITASVRDPEFVREEWEQRLESVVGEATGTWATILYMSYATVQKHAAFKEMLTTAADDGLLRSWALYWAATRPDCDTYCDHDEVELDEAPETDPTPSPSSGTPSPTPSGDPYGGTAASIPGSIEVEEFDQGGEGVGYSDTTSDNISGAFRPDEGVDIETTPDSGFAVGYIVANEYLRYTVDVTADVDAFDFNFVVSGLSSSGSFRIVAGGTDCDDYETDLTGLVEVPATGGWSIYEDLPISGNNGLSAGSNSIWLCVVSSGFNIDSFTMADASSSSPLPSPTPSPTPSPGEINDAYEGDPIGITSSSDVPGTVEAEDFDDGGEGVGYSDTTSSNLGGAFRTDEGVDVGSTSTDGYFVGWIEAGEYLAYTVDASMDVDAFDFSFLVSAPTDDGSFRIVSGGTGCGDYETDLSGLVEVPSTGGWANYADLPMSGEGRGGLSSGFVTIWLCVISAGFNIDSFTMSASASSLPNITDSGEDDDDDDDDGGEEDGGPYEGILVAIPGKVEAEKFDRGGEGVGYSDTSSANIGGAFRTDEGVDLSTINTGYNVGWIEAGEFLRYTVDVKQQVAAFDFSFLVSAPAGDRGSFRIVTGGTGCGDYSTDLSGLVEVPSTGGWGNYARLPVFNGGTGGLSTGSASIWLCVVSAGFNIDSFTMVPAAT